MAAILFAAMAPFSLAAKAEIIFVDYDVATAKVHGDFPSRAVLADLLAALHGAGAKAVILKFFLDGPGKEPDNTRLAEAIGKGRTVLQASINREPPVTRDLPARFRFAGTPPFEPAIRGDDGWLPLTRFSDKTSRVCFADVRSPERVPMLELFGGNPVPTLYACLLAEVTGKEMTLAPGAANFGKSRLPLSREGEMVISIDPDKAGMRLPALRIFAERSWQTSVRGKVAVLMYTGASSPTVSLHGRAFKVHDLFAMQAVALLATIKISK